MSMIPQLIALRRWRLIVIAGVATVMCIAVARQLSALVECLVVTTLNGSGGSSALVDTWPELDEYANTRFKDATPTIPRIIHQTWRTANLSTYPLAKTSHERWREAYPEWEVRLWTDADIEQLVWTEYRWLYTTFMAYTHNVQRADIARLVLLHKYGGLYADLDVFPVENPAFGVSVDLLRKFRCVLPQASDHRVLTNHWIMCEPKSIVLAALLNRAPAAVSSLWIPYLRVFASTGPLFITEYAMEHLETVPSDAIPPPRAASRPSLTLLGFEMQYHFIYHLAGRSWLTADGRMFQYLDEHPVWPLVGLTLVLVPLAVFLWRRYVRPHHHTLLPRHVI